MSKYSVQQCTLSLWCSARVCACVCVCVKMLGPRDAAELEEWKHTRLMRLLLVTDDMKLLDQHVACVQQCVQNEHAELPLGMCRAFGECLDAEESYRTPGCSLLRVYKLYTVFLGLMCCRSVLDLFMKCNSDPNERRRFNVWLEYLKSEHAKYMMRVTVEGEAAGHPKDVYYKTLHHFVDKMAEAFIMFRFPGNHIKIEL